MFRSQDFHPNWEFYALRGFHPLDLFCSVKKMFFPVCVRRIAILFSAGFRLIFLFYFLFFLTLWSVSAFFYFSSLLGFSLDHCPNYSVFLPYWLIQSSFLFPFIFVCRFHPWFLVSLWRHDTRLGGGRSDLAAPVQEASGAEEREPVPGSREPDVRPGQGTQLEGPWIMIQSPIYILRNMLLPAVKYSPHSWYLFMYQDYVSFTHLQTATLGCFNIFCTL